MDTVALANYFAGHGVEPSPIEAGRVGAELARALGIPAGTAILLSYQNFSKITLVHKNVTFADFARIREMLGSPLTFASTGRFRSVEYTYANRTRSFRIIVRATSRKEAYLVSIYRLKWPEVRRHYRREKAERRLIRGPETELARQLMSRQ